MGRWIVGALASVLCLACADERSGGQGGQGAPAQTAPAGTGAPATAGAAGRSAPAAHAGAGATSMGADASAPRADAGAVPVEHTATDAGSGSASSDGGRMGVPSPPPEFARYVSRNTVAPGQEQIGVCQSWTLGNEQPVRVNRVVERNLGAFHHSNWIWVDDTSYDGPDGTWPCDERGFDQILAGAVGGVFFAQSTQALTDTQGFPDGVAFEMPAHARIIGDVTCSIRAIPRSRPA